MSVCRQEVPALAATLIAPVLAVGALLVLPVRHAAEPGRCPQCGQPLHAGRPHADPQPAASTERARPGVRHAD